jgi:hypothetical protein
MNQPDLLNLKDSYRNICYYSIVSDHSTKALSTAITDFGLTSYQFKQSDTQESLSFTGKVTRQKRLHVRPQITCARMPGTVIFKGQLRVTLPLKSSTSSKQQRTRKEQQDDLKTQKSPKWQSPTPLRSKQSMLALKRRAHQHYKRLHHTHSIRTSPLHSPPVDPFTTWPIPVTSAVVPRMAQYCMCRKENMPPSVTNMSSCSELGSRTWLCFRN